jgi:NADPH-dependent 2,4-dienoyl-CoA reductase/sulfur reductase-like enzyme
MNRPLVIVGAGPAGMAAAIAAAEAGVDPLVIDDNPRPGGQIYRQGPALAEQDPRGADLLGRFAALGHRITLLGSTSVWGLFPPRQVAIHGVGGSSMIQAEQLILAPGAYEYVPPFPGWTLPGVMTPGAAQQMVKTMGVAPGQRAVVAGSGPFLLVVAEQLHRAGVQVVAVIEAASAWQFLRAVPALLSQPGLLREGIGYLYRLELAAVPIHRGQLVTEARGDGEVRQVVVCPCDQRWRPDRSRARVIAADTLCIGYGFVPRSQLAQLAGCKMHFDEQRGGWAAQRDDTLQTSVPGVRVAGDAGGIGGALLAREEGTLAGLAAAWELKAIDETTFRKARSAILHRSRKLLRFQAALARVSKIQPGLSTLPADDTIVCRCEELTRAEVEEGIGFGGTDLRSLKVMTRLGMGPCQGAMCWPAMVRMLAARTGKSLEEIGPISVRPPIAPVRLGDLAGGEGE